MSLSFLVLSLIFFSTVYIFLKKYFEEAFSYWKNLGVATLPYTIPFGNTGNPRNRKDAYYISVSKTYLKLKSQGYKYAGFYMSLRPAFIPIDPNLIKHIMSINFSHFTERGLYLNRNKDPLNVNLFFEGGTKWRNLRTKLTPTFTSGKMKMMFNTLIECTNPLEKEIGRLSESEKPIDIKELSGCYTTDVIGSCAFGLDCNSFKTPNAEFRKYGKKIFEFSSWRTITRTIAILYPKLGEKLGIHITSKEVTDFFTEVVRTTITHRNEAHINRNDFLQLLIELQNSGALNEDEIAPQAFVFFLAGFETSSTTISFCLYELAKNQEIQERVRKEINNMVNNELTYEHLAEMKYLTAVIDETLRMYPILGCIHRTCNEDFTIPGESLVIKKGMNVMIPVYGLHHDPEYFPDPEKFDPERFVEENKAKIPSYTYLPFGEGPRLCIGMRFGMMQTKVALATIIRKYNVTLNPVTPKSLKWNPNSFVLQSPDKIYLNVQKI